MAGDAAFGFYRRMFKDERSCLVSMAGEAHRVLCSSRAQLPGEEPTMWIVAVAAGNQSLIYAMVIGLREVWLNFKMAAIAQLRLAGFHQMGLDFGRVHRVTV